MVLVVSKVSSTGTTSGFCTWSSRSLARLCATTRAPAILEGLAAGDVIEVVVAVDQVADRLVGHLLDLVDVVLHTLRPRVADRIGGDDTVARDDEHRLRAAVAENVDTVGALD